MIPVSSDAFADAVRQRLSLTLPEAPQELFPPRPGGVQDEGDPTVNEGLPAKPAAVLIPVVLREEPTVLLTQRSSALPSHSGQIAFPGGKIDPTDASPLDAALREAEEEVGLDRRHVRPLAYMPPFLSRTGYFITPVIGLVQPPFELTINHGEVTDAFEVPLAFLMDPRNHRLESRVWKGEMRHFYVMPYGERYIWGITAGILRNLWERLADQAPSNAA